MLTIFASHSIILYQTDPWLYVFEFKVNVLSIWAPFITLILPGITLFLHPDLGKPQIFGSVLYFLGIKANVADLGSGERRDTE